MDIYAFENKTDKPELTDSNSEMGARNKGESPMWIRYASTPTRDPVFLDIRRNEHPILSDVE